MADTARPAVELEEAETILTPIEGVDVYDAINSAGLAGYEQITVAADRTYATITWFRKVD